MVRTRQGIASPHGTTARHKGQTETTTNRKERRTKGKGPRKYRDPFYWSLQDLQMNLQERWQLLHAFLPADKSAGTVTALISP